MSQDLNTLANSLRGLMTEYQTNSKMIIDLHTRNDVINSGIRNIYEQIRKTPIELKAPPSDNFDLGERCWICKRPSYYRCFWCFVDKKPCGYCDNHTNKHKIQFPDHNAIFQRVFQLKLERHDYFNKSMVKRTPEQEKEHWLKVLADAQKELSKLE